MTELKYHFNELRRWLSRHIRFAVHPHTHLVARNACWQATGDDPFFLLTPVWNLMPQGWYMLAIEIAADIPFLNIKIYPDYGNDFQETDALSLFVRKGRLAKRLCYFPQMPRRLRLDPNDGPCTFELKHLRLSKVTKRFAIDRMGKKIFGSEYKRFIPEQAGSDETSLKKLWQKYDKLFARHSTIPSIQCYDEWISRNETPAKNECDDLVENSYQPLISIIVPVWNTPEQLLRKCIESVQRQIYQNWELCLADDASTHPHIKNVLTEYIASDTRIACCYRAENGHICKASNSALELAKGEFVALLDHDDELSPDALIEVVRALQKNPGAQIIYSDEDKIDAEGHRFEPVFKPDWNRDLLYSQNYISHLGVYRTALLHEIGGFRPGFEGSQDYDLLLRCVARVTDTEIVHIPKVLYHWRAVEGSTALNSDCKSYTEDAGLRALRDHFKECGVDVGVTTGDIPNTYRVQWTTPSQPPLASLLIPTRDNHRLLEKCINSILAKTSYEPYEIIILDNRTTCRSSLAYLEQAARHERIRVIQCDMPFNYSAINNFGVQQAAGEIIGLINNDIEVIGRDWLLEMVSHVIRPDIGCVGAKLYYQNDTIQHAGVVLGIGGVANHSHLRFARHENGYFGRLKVTQDFSAVTAACLLVRKSIYEQVGGLNEVDLKIAFNDVDFCLRVRQAGYRNVWTPYAELYHSESESRGFDDTPEKMARFAREVAFMRKSWANEIDNDPCYNPNLTKTRTDFSLA